MKKIFLLMPVLFFSIILLAQPPKGPANAGMTFGEKTSEEGAVAAEDLAVTLKTTDASEIKVRGTVVEVCKAEGCWIRMETPDGTMLVKMKDHAFMVPLSLNGKTIIAQGTASMKETSVEMLRHYAEDAGKTKAEIEAIKIPKKEITMQAKGILVL